MYSHIKKTSYCQGPRRGYNDMPDSLRPTSEDAYENNVIAFFVVNHGATKENIVEYAHKILDAAKSEEYQSEVIGSIIAAERKSLTDNERLLSLPAMLSVDHAIADRVSDINRDFGTLEGAVISAERVHQRAIKEKKNVDAQQYFYDLKNAHTPEERRQAEADHRRRMEELEGENNAENDIVSYEKMFCELERMDREGIPVRETIPTGLNRIDSLSGGGIGINELTVICGRCGDGKSLLAGQIAANMAEAGIPALFFSMEMTVFSFCNRVRINKLTAGGNLALYVSDGPKTMEEIETITRRAVKKHGVKAIFIDYLAYINPNDEQKKMMQFERYAEQTMALVTIAKKLRIAVVLLAQLNRKNAQDDNRRPVLTDIRGGDDIANNSSLIFSIWTPNIEDRNNKKLINLKSREGVGGYEIDLNMVGERYRFNEIATEPSALREDDIFGDYSSVRFEN